MNAVAGRAHSRATTIPRYQGRRASVTRAMGRGEPTRVGCMMHRRSRSSDRIAELNCRATARVARCSHRHEKHSATAGILLGTPEIWSRRNAIVRPVSSRAKKNVPSARLRTRHQSIDGLVAHAPTRPRRAPTSGFSLTSGGLAGAAPVALPRGAARWFARSARQRPGRASPAARR
jgi:hypothetical protein